MEDEKGMIYPTFQGGEIEGQWNVKPHLERWGNIMKSPLGDLGAKNELQSDNKCNSSDE